MNDQATSYEFPAYSWPTSGWWFTVVGTIAGGVIFLAPAVANWPLFTRLTLFAAIASLPAASIFFKTYASRLFVFYRRAVAYDSTQEELRNLRDESEKNCNLAAILLQERQNANSLQIENGYIYDAIPFVSLYRKRGFKVEIGDRMTVVDCTNGMHLGDFEITEKNPQKYIAKAIADIHPLWMGFMVQTGATPSAPPPDSLAIRFKNGDENNDD